jgi:glyoxylase-like metal-dependent hydrolase (beta-lactamase superfamily II)
MDPMILQPVLGTENVTVYPYLRKIDLMSSNSYILSSPNQISLIDPGGLDSQVIDLNEAVSVLQDEKHRPVVVYLTHVHIDHWFKLNQGRELAGLSRAFLAVQETGARALETNDPQMTLCTLLGRPMSTVPVDIKLLSSLDKTILCENSIDLKGWNFDYVTKSRQVAEDVVLYSQIIPLGDEDHLEIYHTPGHSPDSVCIRAGSMLFVGDIFFAPNPGMAGAYGWSQKDFLQSILKIIWILDNEKIQLCGSGHGRFIDAKTAHKTLEAMYSDAACLNELEEITPLWARRTTEYALDLKGELERTFSIIAGRLVYVSHMMSELEEVTQAKELDMLSNSRQLDDLFEDLHQFSMELRAGKKLNWEIVHKTGQIIGKLDKLFAKQKLESILDQSLLNRAGRLLSDYSATYRGFRPPYIASNADANQLIEGVLKKITHNPCLEEAILQAESTEDYLKALTASIANVNLFENADLKFLPGADRAYARMDQERFAETLTDMLERFAGAGIKDIDIATTLNDEWLTVRITGRGECVCHPLSRAKRFFERSLALSGGLLQISFENNCASVEIEFFTNQGSEQVSS